MQKGHLAKQGMFVKICNVVAEKVLRENSANPHAMRGMRYDEEALAFFIAMRGHGQRSSAQYGLLRQVIGGVSERQIRCVTGGGACAIAASECLLRKITAKSVSSMDNMEVTPHNVKRVAEMVRKKGYQGVPIVLSKDATVVCRLWFLCQYTAHIPSAQGAPFLLRPVWIAYPWRGQESC
jgi:hypothetical protein